MPRSKRKTNKNVIKIGSTVTQDADNAQASSNRDQSPILDDSDLNLFVLLDSAAFLIARMRALELAKVGLTLEQAHVLHLLNNTGSTTMREISHFNKRQHHSVSTLINRMIEAGLVYKVKEHNQRANQIKMTRAAKEKYVHITKDSITRVFSCLRTEEKQLLALYLNLLRSNVLEVMDK
jgi:DNA-binding MarR family transcriptional regulator